MHWSDKRRFLLHVTGRELNFLMKFLTFSDTVDLVRDKSKITLLQNYFNHIPAPFTYIFPKLTYFISLVNLHLILDEIMLLAKQIAILMELINSIVTVRPEL